MRMSHHSEPDTSDQRRPGPHTVAAYRDALKLLLAFTAARTGTPASRLPGFHNVAINALRLPGATNIAAVPHGTDSRERPARS